MSLSDAPKAVTVDELLAANPFPETLLITRRPSNVEAAEVRSSVSTLYESMVALGGSLRENWNAIFKEADHREKDEQPASAEVTQRNTDKMMAVLDKMRDDINGTLERGVHRSLDNVGGMSAEAQEALVEFWAEMNEFAVTLADWIERLISNIIDRLLAGQNIDREAFGSAIQRAMDILSRKLGQSPAAAASASFEQHEATPDDASCVTEVDHDGDRGRNKQGEHHHTNQQHNDS